MSQSINVAISDKLKKLQGKFGANIVYYGKRLQNVDVTVRGSACRIRLMDIYHKQKRRIFKRRGLPIQ